MTDTPALRNVADLAWRTATRHPGRPAIVDRAETLDHAGLRAGAAAVAAALRTDGVAPGDRVAVFLERGAAAAAAFFGVTAAGAIAVVVNEGLRARQVEHILAQAGAVRLLSNDDMLARLGRPLEPAPRILDPRTFPAAGVGHPLPRSSDDPAQLVYTSGSTGAPKGVTITHGNLLAAATTVSDYLGITPTDRIAGLLTLSSVYGMSQLLCTVTTGAALVVERAALPREIVRRLAEERVTVLAAVPPLWLRLLHGGGLGESPLTSLRVLTNAGGHLPVEAVRALRRAQPQARLFLMYGLTEVLRSTYLPPEEVDRRPDSIGRAIPGAEVLVVGEDGRPVPAGVAGELVHRGPTVALGYWQDPARTAEVFRPDPRDPTAARRVVYSGDLVRADAEGFLYYVGRKDRVIKAMGYRVGPDEIVDALFASGQVTAAEAFGEPDPVWGARIVACVVLRPGGSLAAVREFCARELPRHMLPARYQVLEAMPLLPSGKHDLTALRREVAAAGS